MASSRTPRQVRIAVYDSFNTYWQGVEANPPEIVWDGKEFASSGLEHVWFTLAHGAGTIAALGNEKYRRLGQLVCNIFVPEGSGKKRADELAEYALAWFESFAGVEGVRLRDVGYNEAGASAGYWQASVNAGFEYDSIRS